MSTGSLGQGVSTAAGMALGAKRLGNGVRVYTLLGDGEIEEGQVWEAMMFASHYKLDNLLVFVDNNNLQIDGAVSDEFSEGKIAYIDGKWIQTEEVPEGTPYVTAQYNKAGGWTFGAENFDAHEFVVCEQGEIIGNGLVINVNALL